MKYDWLEIGFLIIGALILLWVGGTIFYLVCRGLYLGLKSKNWPTVQGSIVSSEVITTQYWTPRYASVETTYNYLPQVSFAYVVNGKQYYGKNISFRLGRYPQIISAHPISGKQSFNKNSSFQLGATDSKDKAEKEISNYIPNKFVTVFYHQSKPEVSVLEPGLSIFQIILYISYFILGTILIGLSLGLIFLFQYHSVIFKSIST